MRRQTEAGGLESAGSSRPVRLDPFALPLLFSAADATADGGIRTVELHRQHVIVRRAIRGMKMAVHLPLRAFVGVALHLRPGTSKELGTMAVVLKHHDPDLSLPLYVRRRADDVVTEWHCWGRVLGLPLLLADSDGKLHEAFPQFGRLRVAAAKVRRRRHGPINKRRPSILMRRRLGRGGTLPVHCDEREIIARN